MYFVSGDSWSSLRERLVPSNYYVVEECHCVMGVVVSRKARLSVDFIIS